MKLRSYIATLMLTSLMACSGCSSANTANVLEGNQLYICGSRQLAAVDLDQDTSRTGESKYFVQSISYDSWHKRLVTCINDSDRGFSGLGYWDGKSIQLDGLHNENFVPAQLYSFENLYLMDSAMLFGENGAPMAELGIYDPDKKKMLKKFRVPGYVQDIAGSGSVAYVSSYLHPKEAPNSGKKSNIYEVNLKTLEVRNPFPNGETFVPFALAAHDGYVYGVYWTANNIPEGAPINTFVKFDPKTGKILQQVRLNLFARYAVISSDGRYAFVSHLPNLFVKDKNAPVPLSRIDLKTFEVKEAHGDYRATSIIEQDGKVYLGTDVNDEITVVNGDSLQVEKTIKDLKVIPDMMANQRKHGYPGPL